ncbi:MAG TPA: hfsB [Caulobacteraceae bacterium]|nr:hfsB [Caulobacteraceae bacterium]
MVDLTGEMAELWAALGPVPLQRGRAIQFVAARTGEGTSTIAREFARLAAVRARKPAWLIDADLYDQSQLKVVGFQPDRFGGLQGEASASPDGSMFFDIHPPVRNRAGQVLGAARLVQARAALGGRLWVTRLRTEALNASHRVRLADSGGYWEAMRRHADYVIVDSPAADRSDVAATLAPHLDATVLVVAADEAQPGELADLRDAIEARGGYVAGMVLNRAPDEAGAKRSRSS